MKKPKSTKITHEGIIATMRDMIDIFSASQDKLREGLTASQDKLRGEFVSFKTEMYEFERGHNLTLQHHTAQLENIEQHLIDHHNLESRVRQLEKVRS